LVKKYLAKQNVTALKHLPYALDLSRTDFFLFPQIKSVLKGQQFVSTKEGTAGVLRALTEVSKNGFQECFQKLYKRWRKDILRK
jgi:hypothetical protein